MRPTLSGPMYCNPQVLLSMELSWQEYWSGWLFPSPGDLPDPVFKPESPALQADSLPSEPLGKPLSSFEMSIKKLWAANNKKPTNAG